MKFKSKIIEFVLEAVSFLMVLVATLAFAIALSGCSNNPQEPLPDMNRDTFHIRNKGGFEAFKFEHDGHHYIFFKGILREYSGFVHDPDCKCV